MFLLETTAGDERFGPLGIVFFLSDILQMESDQPLTSTVTNGKSAKDGD